MSAKRCSLGLDYGTNSVRALIADVANGCELGAFVHNYRRGKDGILLDEKDHNVARQHPQDYLDGLVCAVKGAVKEAKKNHKNFDAADIIGIGVDTTGSTPMPVDKDGNPLCFHAEFKDDINAMAWLWKDHSSFAEAAEITEKARKFRPEYLAKCGGTYSSEWFFSKALHCARVAPKVFNAMASWVEYCDYIPAALTGDTNPARIKRGICAAGHKAMYCEQWGGLPDKQFLNAVDKRLAPLRAKLYDKAYTADVPAGALSADWAKKLGLRAGIAVSGGAFDAHMGAVGSGIKPGVLVKILGTSTCDMMVAPNTGKLADIPGLCGIVDGSILPGYYGLEAGQSAVGDIFNWFVQYFPPLQLLPGKDRGAASPVALHDALTRGAGALKPGESGLLALDWNNGNRTILVDPLLTGAVIGYTLHTTPAEVYRALIEGTAFGAGVICGRFEEYGVKVREVVNCGGIAEKNSLLMQIYADVLGRPMKIARSGQACALGAAIFGAVAAGESAGGHANCSQAQAAMCGLKSKVYEPIPENRKVYAELAKIYRDLHDAFGTRDAKANLSRVMKKLLRIKSEVRGLAG
ncbi:MAG TPA: ribulokinase [Candidatus Brocadiia bacterium]|nr:ribulokinase [Candidatus Brocadiia bacterium]